MESNNSSGRRRREQVAIHSPESQFPRMETEDAISNMPDNVVTHILDRLPVQDAMRTSILAKNWRYKWTMLSHLVFDENFWKYLRKTNDGSKFGNFWKYLRNGSKFGRIISRLLLHINGDITKFELYIDESCKLDVEDIAHWMLVLSKKGVKDLTIINMGSLFKLPSHLFACLELKHLKLFACCFDPPASFHGFPNLLSFHDGLVSFESGKSGEFITQCPLLEILNMHYRYWRQLLEEVEDILFSVGNVKIVDIAKLANLKVLSLSLRHVVDSVPITSILELAGFLPKLQELSLDFLKYKFIEGGAKNKVLTTFPSLKTLRLSRIDLRNGIMLSSALELIRSFSNLRTLEVTSVSNDDPTPAAICSQEVDYNTMGPLQLRNAVFTDLKGSENELCLIKYVLACSPFLEKIVIRPDSLLVASEDKLFVKKLLKLRRASPKAEIDLY